MKKRRILYLVFFFLLLQACSRPAGDTAEEEDIVTQTPVKVSTVTVGPLNDYEEFNATSAYLERSILKSMISGYITRAAVKPGDFVKQGQVIFQLITREARALGNSVNKLDSGFRFSGISVIRAAKSGYIAEVNHQLNDYVQEGEQLAVVNNGNSFVFLLDLPYESRKLLPANRYVELVLPDGEKLRGAVSEALPAVDSVSQTQRFSVRVNAAHPIPEKLIAKVRLMKSTSGSAQTIARSAVLTNETEDGFWVMKLINDTTAVKIPVEKGVQNDKVIELKSPRFSASDRIVISGNYGLADTAKVKIIR
ncbi:efflux RND transporter periplasmic adaptor subunit [Hufsiella ginkgonis]|uniref:HlyD family efflux transporter periplasmic adaptor subunit n=1 Tax=Hufsiella ginkgonis TaxID=2695274 RepID=A0A7K1XSY6_9SPHI|nr:HlyD family efflux transporter periplasmic adaptor subunit [Hufsiella ginkgonis]MXV14030.1 HlyD family efflux transporter periplasmic adaptor subunit [Hufsiella ginkgonis]